MVFSFASGRFLLCILLVSQANLSVAREITGKGWGKQSVREGDYMPIIAKKGGYHGHGDMHSIHAGSVDFQMRREHVHAHSSVQMDHMDPALNIFFPINDLKVGKKMPIYFPIKVLSKSPRFLAWDEADSIPFSSGQFPYLLDFFSFSKDSPQAKAMEDTLTHCEFEPLRGETKFCATSLESMLDSIRGIVGSESQIRVLTTAHLSDHTALLQNYTIMDVPKEISASRIVGCHTMPYPYAVFYCHSQESDNKLFEVSLAGENGERVKAAAICHMDTSQWDPDHVSFHILKTKPGGSPVCHFFPADNLIWVSSPPTTT